ncbi:hypothetical protein McpCs1_14680 [Methanocorpusculaceae archaeon Cs1]|uniref:Uncharacterized protein n=2 Tax=Methanorbis rubei TaxID=3028300 RepID=A0AAE4MH02_9EURY|nr:hypothetical protein [Methanocorpusculaceae archaeon Cs1]
MSERRLKKIGSNCRHLTISPVEGVITEDKKMSKCFDICVKHLKKFFPDVHAGEIIFHPYRLREDVRARLIQYCKDQELNEPSYSSGGFWKLAHDDVLNLGSLSAYRVFSPHFHLLCFGYFPRADEYFLDTGGWVYKNIRSVSLKIEIREDGSHANDVEAVAAYLLTHCGIELNESGKAVKTHRAFGLMSPRYFRLGTGECIYLSSFLLCPKCLEKSEKTHLLLYDIDDNPMLHHDYIDGVDEPCEVRVVTKIPNYILHAPEPRKPRPCFGVSAMLMTDNRHKKEV